MTRRSPSYTAVLGAAALALAGCGRDAAVQPAVGALSVRVTTAPRSPAAPVVGAVDSLRVYLRGPGNELLVHPALVAIEPEQTRFSVALEAVPGENRSITVLAGGGRPVDEGRDDLPVVVRGILFAGRAEGIDIVPGRIPTITVRLDLFVPEFLAPRTTRGSAAHTVTWTEIPTADHYRLTVTTSLGTETVTVLEPEYDGTILPARYQVLAVEFSGISGAPSDVFEVVGEVPIAPTLSLAGTGPGRIDLAWTSAGDNLDGHELQRSEGFLLEFEPLAMLPGDASAYSDATAVPEVDYTYRLRALSPAGPSDWSNLVNATAPFPPPGTPVNLTARAEDASTILVGWGAGAGGADTYDVERRAGGGGFQLIATPAGTARSYRDEGLADGVVWDYRVRGVSRGGVSEFSNIASAATPLTAPTGFTASATTPTRVDLAWNDNSVSETGYEIQRRSVSSGGFQPLVTVAANAEQFGDETVGENATFSYRVRAVNEAGVSAWSEETTVTTPITPPAAPSNLRITATSGTRIDLAWTDNATTETGFELQRAVGSGAFAVLALPAANVVVYTDTQVLPQTTYQYRIRSVNSGGSSAFSNVASTATPELAPGAPQNLTAVAPAFNRVVLSWAPGSGSAVSQTIERRIPPAAFAILAVVSGTTTGFSDTGVNASTSYEYRVKATNSGGDSPYSNIAPATTPEAPPGAPQNLTAQPVSPNRIDLAWSSGTGNILSQTIERRIPPAAFAVLMTVSAQVAGFTDTGVAESTTYEYRVKATNGGGDSPYSNTASAATPLAPPAAPSNLRITATAGTRIDLAWTDNATTETGFELQRAVGSGAFAVLALPAANVVVYTDTQVLPQMTYQYRIRSVNSGGSSAFSNVASATTPEVAPGAPQNLTAVAPAFNRVVLSWAPGSGSAVSQTIERRIPPAAFAILAVVSGTTTGFSDTGVSASTSYEYRVKSTNSGGDSPYSNIAPATTPEAPPGAPQNLTAQPISPNRIDLAWSSGTGNILSQTIERRIPPAAFTVLMTVSAQVTGFTDTGVAESTTYEYRVKATNGGGDSPYSNTASATPPLALPAAPSNLTVTFVFQNQINIAWTDNASNESGVEVERATGTGPFGLVTTLPANTTSYASQDLSSATLYTFRVRAVNGAGKSAYSNTVQATTPPSPPSAPSSVASDGLSLEIGVYWVDTSNNEDGFRIERRVDSGPYLEIGTTGPNTGMFLDVNPVCFGTHVYRVRAYNAGGNSQYSAESNSSYWNCSVQ